MTFDAKAFAATMRAFSRKKFPSVDVINDACDAMQVDLRKTYEFASVGMQQDGKEVLITVDQAPESLEEFKGQNGRVLFTFVWADNSELIYASTQDLNA